MSVRAGLKLWDLGQRLRDAHQGRQLGTERRTLWRRLCSDIPLCLIMTAIFGALAYKVGEVLAAETPDSARTLISDTALLAFLLFCGLFVFVWQYEKREVAAKFRAVEETSARKSPYAVEQDLRRF